MNAAPLQLPTDLPVSGTEPARLVTATARLVAVPRHGALSLSLTHTHSLSHSLTHKLSRLLSLPLSLSHKLSRSLSLARSRSRRA